MAEKRTALRELPLLALRGMVVFPSTLAPLEVGRDKSVSAVEQAVAGDKMIVLAAQKEVKVDQPEPGDIYGTGTVCEVKQVAKMPGGTLRVLVEGKYRAKIIRFLSVTPYFRVLVYEFQDGGGAKSAEIEALHRAVLEQYENYVKMSKKLPAEALTNVVAIQEPGKLADVIAAQMILKPEEKQAILDAVDPKHRLEVVLDFLNRELELLELERKINVRVKKQIERTQKEYYLREQMKAIQKELGEKDDRSEEAEEFRTKIKQMCLPKDIEEKALKEVERLEKMPPMAAEAVVVRNYLEWIVSLPWTVLTEDRIDIAEARRILDEDHYGLEKVKERILEYLAVRRLVNSMKGPILCLVGPPGVGKTSLGKSIARALGRKFVRISLGGIRDEAEIRGHRRTYVGALPGRIIHGMRQAGSRNPVFLMDEIDKLGQDFRGDPASALLEVLDPEQNVAFSDHYLEIPFDLSKVLFMTTANQTHTIPRPLLDRMEVINIPGYTDYEKIQIAKRFLVPRQLKEHGLSESDLRISDSATASIIARYTREAGVRNLEREIAAICRKAAKKVVSGIPANGGADERPGNGRRARKPLVVTKRNLSKYLGIPKYKYGEAEHKDEVGVAMGVAVTEAGGDIMPVEVGVMSGKGNLTLTGKLGEVMRESAQAAFSYVKSRARLFGWHDNFHEKFDVHVHVPEGAIPKDGPSAGVTIAAAMVSALTGISVRHDVAMTGEITLRGRVLEVGGIKEKALAVHRAGIPKMVIPRENEKDLEDIPSEIRNKIRFVLVDHMDEVLSIALSRPVVGQDAWREEGPDRRADVEVLPPALPPFGQRMLPEPQEIRLPRDETA